jgi:hypothetical protein
MLLLLLLRHALSCDVASLTIAFAHVWNDSLPYLLGRDTRWHAKSPIYYGIPVDPEISSCLLPHLLY